MFRFALDPLLEVRRRAEDAARASFERRRCAHAAACAEMAALEGELQRRAGAIGPAALLAAIATALDARRRAADGALAALDQAHERLIAASRARTAIEMLRERRYAAYEAERRRLERAEVDEANARAGTSRRGFSSCPPTSSATISSRWLPSR